MLKNFRAALAALALASFIAPAIAQPGPGGPGPVPPPGPWLYAAPAIYPPAGSCILMPQLVSGGCPGGGNSINISGTFSQNGIPLSPTGAIAQMDVFLIGGDSNARGRGDSTQSPQVPAGFALMYCSTGLPLQAADDPFCSAVGSANNALTGSAWPSFALTFYNATGHRVMLVHAGIGGSYQVAAADVSGTNNWDVSGPLFAQAIAALNTALAAATTAGYVPVFRGVLMDLGTNDATAINASTINVGQYSAALTSMVARFRAATIGGATYPQMPFYNFRIGTKPSVSDAGFAQVRAAQDAYVAGDILSREVAQDAVNFPALGYQQAVPNDSHYTQAGYNMLGRVGASNVVSAQALAGWQPSGLSNNIFYAAGSVIVGYPVSSGAPFSVNTLGAALPAPINAGDSQFSTATEVINFGAGAVDFFRYANGSATTPTQVVSGNIFGGTAWRGFDGSAAWSGSAASIIAVTTDTWNDATHHGLDLHVRVTPNGTATLTDSLFFVNDTGIYCPLASGGDKGADTFNCGTVFSGGNQVATLAGNQTFTGTNIFTGAAAASPTSGQASFGGSSSLGAVIIGNGTNDVTLENRNGVDVCNVGGNTTTFECLALGLATPLGVGSGGTGLATLTTNAILTGNGGGTINQVAITGLMLGNGASAPTAYAGTSCTSQSVTALSASGVATCGSPPAGPVAVGDSLTGGTPNGLLYNNANTIGNLASANNGILVTSGAGVPSIATTLPSGLTIPSPTVTGTMTAAAINASGNFNVTGYIQPNMAATLTCGSGCSTVTGTPQSFTFTTGTAQTSVTVNFGVTWPATPRCTIGSGSTASIVDISSKSTTSITFGASVALTATSIDVHCF